MIKTGQVNPLMVHDLRKLDHCPPHFEKVTFDLHAAEKEILDWIYENLSGRFYMGIQDRRSAGSTSRQHCVSFEDPSEASYFGLFLHQINTNDFFILN